MATAAPSPTDADGNVQLSTLGTDHQAAAVQAPFPAPLKLVHDADCSEPPTLVLPFARGSHGAPTVFHRRATEPSSWATAQRPRRTGELRRIL